MNLGIKPLTKPLPACWNSGAFSETTGGALFLPGAKYERSPSSEGLFLFQRHLIRKAPGVGYLEGRCVVSEGIP